MYNYVTNKQLISSMRSCCGDMMQDLCHTLKEVSDIGAELTLVGSGARNLILQNANEPIDLDYNLKIVRSDDWDCKYIKECVRKAFNIVLRKHGWRDCEDSKSSLTTKKHYLPGSKTLFSIDVCIVYEDEDGNLYRLIHKKLVILMLTVLHMLLAFILVLLLEGLLMNTIGIRLQILEILNLKSIILKVMVSGN